MHAAPGATGEFTSLLNHISLAIRIINSRVRAAGLAGLLGYTGETNVQGEEVQKLDAFSNEVLLNVLERSGHCGVIASEELDEAILAHEPRQVRRALRPARRLEQHRHERRHRHHLRDPPPVASRSSRRRASPTRSGPGARSSPRATCSTARRRSSSSRPARARTASRSTRRSASSSSRSPNITCPRARQLLLGQRGQLLALDARDPAAGHAGSRATRRSTPDERGRVQDAVRRALRRLARRRRAPHADQGRHLRVPGRHEEHERQAPPPLRGEPDGVPLRAGGRREHERQGAHPRHRARRRSTSGRRSSSARKDDVAAFRQFVRGER